MWFGRCNALKMTMLPMVLYLLEALSIHLPLVFFMRVSSRFWILCGLIAGLALSFNLISQSLPDVRAYYKAAHLTRLALALPCGSKILSGHGIRRLQ